MTEAKSACSELIDRITLFHTPGDLESGPLPSPRVTRWIERRMARRAASFRDDE